MSDSTVPGAEPLFFGPPDRPLFGWLHRASAASLGRLGVVICSPFGYEAVCAHRTIRHLATAISASGIACLRFDYDGSWDSAGSDLDPDRLRAWTGSVHSAIAAIREMADVERVSLVGIRMGAMLAATAAAESGDVDGIVAIAPVIRGRAYQRELIALQGSHQRGNPDKVVNGIHEALGTQLSRETWEAMAAADLLRIEQPPAAHVLVLDRDDLPQSASWVSHLTALGAEVTDRSLPGFTEMMRSPHESMVPAEMIREATAWLVRLGSDIPAIMPRKKSEVAPSGSAEREWRVSPTDESPIRERVVFLDDGRGMFGILTDRASNPAGSGKKCILLLNSGAIHHVGPNRLYVTVARLWARAGHTVLRFDLQGLGDSVAQADRPENIVYPAHAVENVELAMRWLRSNVSATEYHVIGLCSGAYHAMKSAAADLGIRGAVMINPLTFFWKEGMTLDYAPHHVIAESNRYRHSLFARSSWSRLLHGRVDILNVSRILCQRLAANLGYRARRFLTRLGFPLQDDLGMELLSISRNDIRMQFVFSESDPGWDLLRLQGGTSFARLRGEGRLQVSVVQGADHTFTLYSPRHALIDLLTAYVNRPSLPTVIQGKA